MTTGRIHAQQEGISAQTLKIIAICCMALDHTVTVFVPFGPLAAFLHIPGRLVAPIMCYCVAEGFHYTRSVPRYAARLFAFAAVSHFPYVWAFRLPWAQATSVMWSLALGLVALAAAKSPRLPLALKIAAVGAACILATPADWHYVAVLWILVFGLFRGNYEVQMWLFAAIGIGFAAMPALLRTGPLGSYQFAILLAIPLLGLYHGKRGGFKRGHGLLAGIQKWGFYWFYPGHLLVLYALRILVRGG